VLHNKLHKKIKRLLDYDFAGAKVAKRKKECEEGHRLANKLKNKEKKVQKQLVEKSDAKIGSNGQSQVKKMQDKTRKLSEKCRNLVHAQEDSRAKLDAIAKKVEEHEGAFFEVEG